MKDVIFMILFPASFLMPAAFGGFGWIIFAGLWIGFAILAWSIKRNHQNNMKRLHDLLNQADSREARRD